MQRPVDEIFNILNVFVFYFLGMSSKTPLNVPISSGHFELSTHVELKRVKAKLYKEVSKIKYPKRYSYLRHKYLNIQVYFLFIYL